MGLVRASRSTVQRTVATVRLGEGHPQGRRGIEPVSAIAPQPAQTIAIELNGTLVASGSAAAYVRRWNSATNAYVTDTGDPITVKDSKEVGYNGASGAKGAAIIKFLSDGTRYGELVDLECP